MIKVWNSDKGQERRAATAATDVQPDLDDLDDLDVTRVHVHARQTSGISMHASLTFSSALQARPLVAGTLKRHDTRHMMRARHPLSRARDDDDVGATLDGSAGAAVEG